MPQVKSTRKSRIVTECKYMIAIVLLATIGVIANVAMTFRNLANRGFCTVLLFSLISTTLVLVFCSCDDGQAKTHPSELTQAGIVVASGEVEIQD